MHPSVVLLNEALALVSFEESALLEEDMDTAEKLADKRAGLISDAWRLREGCPEGDLVEKLLQIESMQRQLCGKAEALRDKLGAQMHTERKQSKYLDGYRYDTSQARKALYCDKQS